MSASAVRPFGDSARLASLFFVAVSLVLAALVALSRSAFPEPTAATFALAWLNCCSVIFAWQLAAQRAPPGSCGLAPLAAVAAIALPCLSGASFISSLAVTLILLGICTVGFRSALPAIRGITAWQLSSLLLGASVFAVVLFFWTNSKQYASVLHPEFALLGLQNVDTVYHTALSAMVSQHGKVSTGLDGLVATPYHALSHLWIGRLSGWLQTTPIHGYYVVMQVIGLPLLFFSAVVATIHQPADGRAEAIRFPDIVLVPLALVLLIATVDWSSYLVSESHVLGMVLFLTGLPLLLEHAVRPADNESARRVLAIGLLGLLMTLSKVSVGAIWFAGFGFLVARRFLVAQSSAIRAGWVLIGMLVALAVLLPITLAVVPGEHLQQVRFVPFQFALESREFLKVALVNSLAIAIGGLLIVGSLIQRPANFAAEVLGVMMATAWILTMTINVPGGSDYYFLNVGTWLAIVVTARWLLARVDTSNDRFHRRYLVGAIALFLVANKDVLGSYARVKERTAELSRLVGAPETSTLFATKATTDLVPLVVGAQAIASVLRNFSFGEADVLIFVPPENKALWAMDKDCNRKPLLIPAFTAIPMLNGLPPDSLGCRLDPNYARYYGYSKYSTDSISMAASDQQICAKARRLGYSRVGVLFAPDRLRLLHCAAAVKR